MDGEIIPVLAQLGAMKPSEISEIHTDDSKHVGSHDQVILDF